MKHINSNTYQFNVQMPDRRLRKHKKVQKYSTTSVLGNKVLNCPVGGSFAIINDSERTGVHGWARHFNMKFSTRNTLQDSYKRAFRIA